MVHGYACLWSLLQSRMQQRKRGPGTNNAALRPRQAEKARHRVHCPAAGMRSGVELSRGGLYTRLVAMAPVESASSVPPGPLRKKTKCCVRVLFMKNTGGSRIVLPELS